MDERKETGRRTPQSTVHEGCGGVFVFRRELNAEIPEERACQKCLHKESYEKDKLIIAGRPGVPEEKLKEFCKSLHLEAEEVKRDKTNPSILALTVAVPNGGTRLDPEGWLVWKAMKDKMQPLILAVFRKPRPLKS